MIGNLRNRLFDASNTLAIFKNGMKDKTVVINDASPRMTETDRFMIVMELEFIETRMDVLRKRLFDLQV